jgi:hypothetical protein
MVIGSGLAALLLVALLTVAPGFAQGGGMMGGNGGGKMGGYNGSNSGGYGPGWVMGNTQGLTGTHRFDYGPGWMMGQFFNNGSGGFFGPGWMMQNTQGFSGTNQFGPGWMMSQLFGNGAENFFGPGRMMGGGMMVNANNPFYTAPQPLSLAESTIILDAYLSDLNDGNLIYQDVMAFDNHTYAQIVEQDSGVGVMEVLIDPSTQIVYPEMGPNMMWNQQYGMMSGYGRYGMMGGMRGMMGGFNNFGQGFDNGNNVAAEMTVTPAEAVTAAQTYLDANFSEKGFTADEHADPFYGYYTLHVIQDGETVGMLSVNGFNAAVWPHTWHGQLLEMGGE